jgi:uncharacterized membrane protein
MRTILFIGIILIAGSCNNPSVTPGQMSNDTTADADSSSLRHGSITGNINDTVLKATGTEPFWALTIILNKFIEFRSANDSLLVTVPYTNAALMKDRHSARYESATGKDDIIVEIMYKNCSDGMSDFSYPLAVVVTVNGTTYKGCGEDLKEKKTMLPAQ